MDYLNASNYYLPALLTRGVVVLPDNEIKIEIGREYSVNALNKAFDFDNYLILLVQKNPEEENPTVENCYSIGVLAKIKVKVKLPNGNYKIKVDGLTRIQVDSAKFSDDLFYVSASKLDPITENIDEEIATVRLLINEISAKPGILFDPEFDIASEVEGGISSERLANIVSYNLRISEMDKVKYLLELSTNKRLKYILTDINKETYFQELERKISESVKSSIDESQKEYYLREKMKAIQDELGDKARKENEIDDLRKKILDKKMPKNFEEKMLDELHRYEIMPQVSPDSANIRQYIDFVLALPFNEHTEDINDLIRAKQILDKGHYGLDKVKDRIIEYLAVKMATNKNPHTILCLVGPPGVGKTSLAESIAESLGKKYVRIALGGVRDEAEIRGHRRTYLGALPGRILAQMKKAGVNNPLFLIDEIDKLGSDYKGDPSSAMLEVLDPEQNNKFMDHFVEEPYDLSNVLFIATANYLGSIPEALRDRMEIIELSSYTEIEKLEILKKHLVPRQMERHGLKAKEFKVNEGALKALINNYTREAGVRQAERLVGTLCRKAVRKIYEGEVTSVSITTKNIHEFLGKPLFEYNSADKEDYVGTVNGLAYTQFGGDTLQIEATYYPGKGNLILTGKLGEVMQESAKTALSLVKSKASKYNINPEIFEKNDIHVHVPEGAVPKDGPSAGVTLTTAFISALSGKKVRHDVGMTGEITLRGKVLPIGGLREKAIAADRAGLKTILIPYENTKDIDDIPEVVRERLEIICCKEIDEVLDRVLL